MIADDRRCSLTGGGCRHCHFRKGSNRCDATLLLSSVSTKFAWVAEEGIEAETL
jgi:hypothetical protein